jgi:uncharacterized protein
MKYVLYHKSCNDGLGAAYAAWLKFGEQATYIPVQYKQAPPEIESGTDVFIVDFSYPREVLEEIKNASTSLVVLDHHKTAMDDLKDFPGAMFDMNKSGARLAWEYFHPDKDVPELIELVEDRDLWRFKLPDTNAVGAALYLEKDFRNLQYFERDRELIVQKGNMKLSFDAQEIESSVRKAVVSNGNGKRCAIINTGNLISEVGANLYTNYDIDFAMMYFVTSDGTIVFSLRSISTDKMDVSVLAKSLGGGGHPCAAGFSLPMTEGLALLDMLYKHSEPLAPYKL